MMSKKNGMEKVEIYRFQLEKIHNALRLTANAYDCREKVTSLDRIVTQSEQYAQNALDGKIDERVNYL